MIAYNEDVVVGGREWMGPYTDIPTMGDNGSELTKGFMKHGLKPEFKILRDGKLIELENNVPEWSNNSIFKVESLRMLPETFSLETAYPNPFNPVTTLDFSLPIESKVSLIIYNLQGRVVSTLLESNMEPGYHTVQWNADNHSSGIYFVKMHAGSYVSTQKLILVK